jgi:hypothetical protein
MIAINFNIDMGDAWNTRTIRSPPPHDGPGLQNRHQLRHLFDDALSDDVRDQPAIKTKNLAVCTRVAEGASRRSRRNVALRDV